MVRYFLDTSVLAKHDHVEVGTAKVDQIMEEESAELFILRLTLVEMLSVFAIKVRTGTYDAAEFSRLRGLFASHISRKQFEVVRLINPHYELARELLVRSGPSRQIRTLDALQLLVALRLHLRFSLDYLRLLTDPHCEIHVNRIRAEDSSSNHPQISKMAQIGKRPARFSSSAKSAKSADNPPEFNPGHGHFPG